MPCRYFALLTNTFGLLVPEDHAISRLWDFFNLFFVDFLSALNAPCNKLYWCGVYTTLMKGLMSSNGHGGIKCVSHLSNMCYHFGDSCVVLRKP